MAQQIAHYIGAYGYLAIFCIILLQECGVPGLPNELVLFYFGYIGHRQHLLYPAIAGLVIMADIAGSFLLYFVFFKTGAWLLHCKPSWIRLPGRKLDALKQKVILGKRSAIFIAKLTPFVRGYVPIAAGMLRIPPQRYLKTIAATAVLWSGGWVTAGWLVGRL